MKSAGVTGEEACAGCPPGPRGKAGPWALDAGLHRHDGGWGVAGHDVGECLSAWPSDPRVDPRVKPGDED